MIIQGVTVEIGDQVSFGTLNKQDGHVIIGTIQNQCAYKTAIMLDPELHNKYDQIKKSNPGTKFELLQDLSFLTIEQADGILYTISPAWMLAGTFTLIPKGVNRDIRLYDISNERLTAALDILRTNGFSVAPIT